MSVPRPPKYVCPCFNFTFGLLVQNVFNLDNACCRLTQTLFIFPYLYKNSNVKMTKTTICLLFCGSSLIVTQNPRREMGLGTCLFSSVEYISFTNMLLAIFYTSLAFIENTKSLLQLRLYYLKIFSRYGCRTAEL
jgi:hypothetical protein